MNKPKITKVDMQGLTVHNFKNAILKGRISAGMQPTFIEIDNTFQDECSICGQPILFYEEGERVHTAPDDSYLKHKWCHSKD